MPKAIKYLMNMKRLPIVIAMVIAGVFLAFNTMGKSNTPPPGKYEKILQIQRNHFDAGSIFPVNYLCNPCKTVIAATKM